MANVTNQPLTLPASDAAAPGLVINEIDRRVVRVRPSSTPLDQISRLAGSRRTGSMKVEYYSVETKAPEATVKTWEAGREAGGPVTLTIEEAGLLEVSETFMVPTLTDKAGNPAVFYVAAVATSGRITAMPVNPGPDGAGAVAAGGKIVRMGRAATELDVQTPQFQALPSKEWNQCQIFKAQIEESTLHRLSNKEVGWTFNDQEEVAVIDMRLGMEKNFLFGTRAVIADEAKREDVSLTGGIWNQTSHTLTYKAAETPDSLALRLVREAFRNTSGTRRKILLAGGDLIDKLNRQELTRVVGSTGTVTKWGIDFTEICSKFGRLYVIHSEIFDQCGFPGHGMVIDPEYLTKYTFIPMQAERLDLKRSGQRNTDAIVITEASCLVLRYPDTHLRVVAA